VWLWWLFDKFSCLEPAVCTVGACDFFFWWQYLTVECVSQFCRLTRKHSVRLLVWGMTRTCWWNQSKIDCKMRYYSACTLLSSYIFFCCYIHDRITCYMYRQLLHIICCWTIGFVQPVVILELNAKKLWWVAGSCYFCILQYLSFLCQCMFWLAYC
jgi:hypothetical protein